MNNNPKYSDSQQVVDISESQFPDSVMFQDPNAPVEPEEIGPRSHLSSTLSSDMMVYLGIVIIVFLTWRVSKLGLFKAGDDTGYWIGVVGGVLMLLLFTYPLRKHFRFARNWGRVKWWFLVHMVLGIGGPVLILLHSNFRVGSLNAGVALYSMLIVALSGVIGRFLFARVNRGLHGEKATLRDLQIRAGLEEADARSRLAFAPRVEAQLAAFQERELAAKPGFFTYTRQVFWLPIQQGLTYSVCEAELRRTLKVLGKRNHWSAKDYARRKKHSKKLVHQYLFAVTRVAQYTAYSRLFSLWHIAHIPFVFSLVISAIVHVIAVHAY